MDRAGGPHVGQTEYRGLQGIRLAAGMVKEPQPYAKVFRPAFVTAAKAYFP